MLQFKPANVPTLQNDSEVAAYSALLMREKPRAAQHNAGKKNAQTNKTSVPSLKLPPNYRHYKLELACLVFRLFIFRFHMAVFLVSPHSQNAFKQ